MKSCVFVLVVAVLANCGNTKPKQATGDAASDAGRPSGTGGTRTGGAGATRTGGAGGATAGPGSGGVGGADGVGGVGDAGGGGGAGGVGGAGGTDTVDAGPQDAGTAPADADADADPGVPPPACDGMLPACVPPIASYARDLAPVFAAKCNNCHTSEPDKPWPLDTYLNVVSWAGVVADSLVHCTMPPPDGGTPSLTPAEHHAIVNWLACQAPEN